MATHYFKQRQLDRERARQNLEQLVGCRSPEQVQAMYQVSWGLVRDDLAQAIRAHLQRGHPGLAAVFPHWAHLSTISNEQETSPDERP